MPKNIKIAITIILILLISKGITSIYTKSTNIYNLTTSYKLELTQIEQNQSSTWDAYYLNFIEQNL